jgi:hypothetical protein
MGRSLVNLSAVLLVLSGMVTANLWRELRSAREVSAALRVELGGLRAGRVAADTSPATASPAPQERLEVSATATSPAASSAAIVWNAGVAQQSSLTNAEIRALRLATLRSSIAQSYPGLAETLGLTAEEADQIFDLLAEHQMAMATQLTAVQSEDGSASETAVLEMRDSRQALRRQLGDSIRDLLGDARYAEWQAYQPTRPIRMQAKQYATALAQAHAPLDDVQLRAFEAALIEEHRSLQQDTVALARQVDLANPQSQQRASEALRSRRAESSQRVLTAASSQLTAQQISMLRPLLERQEAIQRAGDGAADQNP